jgi:thioredoxin-related protein
MGLLLAADRPLSGMILNSNSEYMKRLRLICFFLLLATGAGAGAGSLSAAELVWRHDPEPALAEARDAGRRVLLYFTASWCGYCRTMENLTFTDAGVRKELENFFLVKANFDTHQLLLGRYGIRGVPATVALNGDGRTIGRTDGYHDAGRFLEWLRQLEGRSGRFDADSLELLEGELRTGLLDENLAPRTEAVLRALASYLDEDRAAAERAARALRRAVGQQPDWFRELLEDRRLAIRILAANLYRDALGADFQFDPWAAEGERQEYLAAFWRARGRND